MYNLKHAAMALVLVASLLLGGPSMDAAARPLAASAVGLGTAGSFAVLAGSGISDVVTTSAIAGNVGLDPTGGAAITGLTCAEVTGTIYDNNGGYTGNGGGSTACRMTDAGLLTSAKNDLVTAYNNAAGQTPVTTVPTELGGQLLTAGIYDTADGTLGLTGTLTLDAEGDPNAVFIFKAASSLVTASNSNVNIINSGQSCNVFWQIGSSATLGTSTNFLGTVLALASITDNGGSTVDGRLLARDGAVTLSDTTINIPACTTAGGGGEGGGGATRRRDRTSQVTGLPNSGGAPIRNAEFPWGLLLVGGITAGAFALQRRSSRRGDMSRK